MIKSKLLLVTLLLLTFIGQASLAVAMPCPEMEESHHAMAAQMAGHKTQSMMNMDLAADKHDQSMPDCCDPECQCPMGGCLSASLAASPQVNSLALLLENIRDRAYPAISQPQNTPYYPPISSLLA
ncbi:hypothetical protein [Thalassomonas haliotis]|uniref:Uncharacterized protein n=1 Tax=Thalassomonas haliotis TaxID=485448 RepID=A0ABY7VEV3_9GAMM|nr:hypothetical protein [Thalassomonas haliotis]WDE11423.1 hypothetical protein H3N35_24950 [Thalassomonas haliotis]